MRFLLHLILNLISTVLTLSKPGGVKALIAENLLLKQQLLIKHRGCKRSPKLTNSDRVLLGALSTLINPDRVNKISVILKPVTLFKFHQYLINRKYQKLFSNTAHLKPGPKGPSQELIDLILEMKRRNPKYGILRITMQINNIFGLNIDKGVVKRVLDKYHKDKPNNDGPSWLTFWGNMKDSLWSIDFFRCESILLKSYWCMVVKDHFTRRIIGFAVHKGDLNGMAICHMFNSLTTNQSLPK